MREMTSWSAKTPVPATQIVAAAAGMAGPIAYGLVSGHLTEGVLAAMGAMTVSGVAPAGSRRSYAGRLLIAAITVSAGCFVGILIAGQGWLTALAIPSIAALVSVAGSFSRPAMEASARFVTLMVIATGFSGAHPIALAAIIAVGSAWAVLVGLFCPRGTPANAQRKQGSPADKRAWRYGARLGLSLAVAEAVAVGWTDPRAYWIAVTVVIVVQRRMDRALLRPAERAAGTAAGVLIASAVLLQAPPAWLFLLLVAALAAIRPYLKVRNYTLYATVMTPLVVLILDFGQPVSVAIIGDRLLDTVIGCAIALLVGYLPWTGPGLSTARSFRAAVERLRDLVAGLSAGIHRRALDRVAGRRTG
jgi:hypothetical protein